MVDRMSDFAIKEKVIHDNISKPVEDEICYQKMYEGICKLQQKYTSISPVQAGDALSIILKALEKYED